MLSFNRFILVEVYCCYIDGEDDTRRSPCSQERTFLVHFWKCHQWTPWQTLWLYFWFHPWCLSCQGSQRYGCLWNSGQELYLHGLWINQYHCRTQYRADHQTSHQGSWLRLTWYRNGLQNCHHHRGSWQTIPRNCKGSPWEQKRIRYWSWWSRLHDWIRYWRNQKLHAFDPWLCLCFGEKIRTM